MDLVAIVGLTAIILIKEIGVPLPVPGDLLLIGAGTYLAGNPPLAGVVLAAILIASFIGASIQFFLLGTALRRPLLALLARLGVGEERIQKLSDRFQSTGGRAVAIARMTPGVRIAVIPAAAIAALPFSTFLPGLAAGNAVFISAHFGVGFVLGASARELIGQLTDPYVIGVVVLVALAVVGFFALRRRAKKAPQEGPSDTYECWADCSCPACVSIVATAGGRAS